jgi:hypothetical protein
MSAIVTTLFEGDYHLGVAALVNSLFGAGFQGEVRVGYRGDLPGWVRGEEVGKVESKKQDCGSMGFCGQSIRRTDLGGGVRVLQLEQCEMKVVFQRLDTEAHFTNYKPQFLLQTLEETQADRIFYFDPDIVVEARWGFFEEWADAGVALAEDVNSPLPENHPRRVAWRNRFEEVGIGLKFRQPAYVNGGFIGMTRKQLSFLETWMQTQGLVSEWVGGSDRAKIGGGVAVSVKPDANDPFSSTDQDALNAAMEACSGEHFSIIGQEAMGFKTGGCIMHHALGPWKPWRRRYLREALCGHPPARVDKIFWRLMEVGPIKPTPLRVVRKKELEIRVAAALGRFIRRT